MQGNFFVLVILLVCILFSKMMYPFVEVQKHERLFSILFMTRFKMSFNFFKLVVVFFVFSMFTIGMEAQTGPGKFWVQFSDKNNSPFSLSNPTDFLSEKCVERRNRLSIGFDQRDLPVNETYINQVLSLGECSLHNKSKWFNAITIATVDTNLINEIENLPFVIAVKSVETLYADHEISSIDKFSVNDNLRSLRNDDLCCDYNEYGPSFLQIQMLNGHLIHQLGYTGRGVCVALFDAGWGGADQLPAFEKLRNDGRIKMERDFVYKESIYNRSTHGTFVLSLMAGIIPDSLIGTAPDADYYLFRTEDPLSEFPVEEDNWVAAAEFADSLGIDVINSSLGYSRFDVEALDHSYADMDGNTTRCSIAADIAAAKGIIVVNSAGNSGNNSWRYITAPSDADSILCVGAIDKDMQHAFFSSYGPASDGDVKPDVVTMGQASVYAALDSTIATGNGTSFSSPICAGLVACLVQAFPQKLNMDVIQAVRESASQFNHPDDSLGYGIPDFLQAWLMLANSEHSLVGDFDMLLYPNPCVDQMTMFLHDAKWCNVAYEIYDVSGKRIFDGYGITGDGESGFIKLDQAVQYLTPGNYVLHAGYAGRHSVAHFQKCDKP